MCARTYAHKQTYIRTSRSRRARAHTHTHTCLELNHRRKSNQTSGLGEKPQLPAQFDTHTYSIRGLVEQNEAKGRGEERAEREGGRRGKGGLDIVEPVGISMRAAGQCVYVCVSAIEW